MIRVLGRWEDCDFGWKVWDIVDIVKNSIDSVSNSCNVVIKYTDETVTSTVTRSFSSFYTKEYTGDTAKRPYLEITHVAPSITGITSITL